MLNDVGHTLECGKRRETCGYIVDMSMVSYKQGMHSVENPVHDLLTT
jgi:hypothetical protein